MSKNFVLILISCFTLGFSSCNQHSVADPNVLLPVPDQFEAKKGVFTLQDHTVIGYATAELKPAADYLCSLLATPTSYDLKVAQGNNGTIQLALSDQGKPGAYTLEVQNKQIVIRGKDYKGVVNGISTLRQLLPVEIESKTMTKMSGWVVPCVKIVDEPRFEWRGMMLDVSRHFFSKAEVKELLDVMALYKLDKLHWHLTDDQGWRIEIKKYPLLTQKGAWRTWNSHDRQCMWRAGKEDNSDLDIPADKIHVEGTDTLYGGFYTQQDIKDIVAYASVRGIDIVPEVDMPGHFLAAISNYSGISCFGKEGWGKSFSSPVCPGKAHALEFCKDVYREIFELFPYKYVHIGGDEVEKTNWEKCPDCQRRIKENNLKDEKELQSWFIKYMEKFFNENGKEMIGWDEILEGGLSKTATVMWWRSWHPDVVQQTTGQGNKVICTPNAQFYLDYQQDKNSLRNIYKYKSLPEELSSQQRDLVMGVQGNLWTEWVPSRERMLYMAFPRMQAIAELGWSKPEQMNWDSFSKRLLMQFKRLERLNINYRIPDLEGFYHSNIFTDSTRVNVTCPDTSAVIRYTVDGTIPTTDSPRYTGELSVNKTTDFTFRTFRFNGKKADIVKTRFIKENYALPVQADALQPGLRAVWHEYRGDRCSEIAEAPVNGTYGVSEVTIPQEVKGNIGLILTGFIKVQKDDIYTFFLLSDDGSTLVIDNRLVVDNDGAHSPREMIGQHAMKAGLHPIEVRYFDHNGGILHLKALDSAGNEVDLGFVSQK